MSGWRGSQIGMRLRHDEILVHFTTGYCVHVGVNGGWEGGEERAAFGSCDAVVYVYDAFCKLHLR